MDDLRVNYTTCLVPSVLIMVYRIGRKLYQWGVLFKTHVINGAILCTIDVK